MDFEKHYLTYDEYRNLGGSNTEVLFNIAELKARKIIDKYTTGKLINLSSQINEVKVCVYDLINTLDSYQKLENKDKSVSSETIDGYSVNYESTINGIAEGKNKELKSIVCDTLAECYLDDGTPYLYRGVK